MYRRGFATKKEATTAQTKALAEVDQGIYVRPGRVTLERFLVDEWLPAKVSTLKPSTKAGGLPIIRLHDVRHSYTTAALAAGVPVKVLFTAPRSR